MSKANPVEAVPFTNDMGHVIQPGDGVLVITGSSHTIGVSKGVYLGSRESRHNKNHRTVQVEIAKKVTEMRHKTTGMKMEWSVPGLWPPRKPSDYEFRSRSRSPSIYSYWEPLTPAEQAAFDAALAKYQVDRAAYDAKWNAYQAEHHLVTLTKYHKKNLQCNRIYPLNISMDEFIKAI